MTKDRPSPSLQTHAGLAALVGASNAGKSTLINKLVGEKVAIVTHKVQTTRFPVRGVMVEDKTQILLLDTPGIFTPRRRLDKAMIESAWLGAGEADCIVHLVDACPEARLARGKASKADQQARLQTRQVQKRLSLRKNKPVFLTLNKTDALARPALLEITASLYEENLYDDVYMISAKTGDGLENLKQGLVRHMPEGPWLYPGDQVKDMPLRLMASEITREKILLRLHEELPYVMTVETHETEHLKKGGMRLEQTVYVLHERHRAMILGHKGETTKAISRAAREDMKQIFKTDIHLFIRIALRPRWMEDPAYYQALGLSFQPSGSQDET